VLAVLDDLVAQTPVPVEERWAGPASV
jgi:hypothetical protein